MLKSIKEVLTKYLNIAKKERVKLVRKMIYIKESYT